MYKWYHYWVYQPSSRAPYLDGFNSYLMCKYLFKVASGLSGHGPYMLDKKEFFAFLLLKALSESTGETQVLVANLFRVASNDRRKKFVDFFLVLPLLLSSQFSKRFLCFCENSTWFWIACFWSQNGIKVEIFEKISKKKKGSASVAL